jgi:hypothetical protein
LVNPVVMRRNIRRTSAFVFESLNDPIHIYQVGEADGAKNRDSPSHWRRFGSTADDTARARREPRRPAGRIGKYVGSTGPSPPHAGG